jgi:glycosyltransferase involved in cell wall biosynthesis
MTTPSARQWTINGRFLTQNQTGVQRYCERIVRALDELITEGHPAVAGLSLEIAVPSRTVRSLPLTNIPLRELPRLSGHAWEQFVLPLAIRGGLLSLGNTGPVVLRKQIVCIHDTNVWLYPESYAPAFRAVYRMLLPGLGRRAAAITTVSGFSASQLSKFGICAANRNDLIGNGHEHAHDWTARRPSSLSKAAGRNTIVLLGSPAPHKNVGLILGLSHELAERGIHIAVVGERDPRVFGELAPSMDAENVHYLGRLSDDELAALLADSLCLVFPSHTEGFGLPAVEAMALGCPVILSNSSCLPEIGGDAALYASPRDATEWLACIDRLKGNPDLRRELIAKGKHQAAKFSWRQSAIRYAELMQRIDGQAA